MSSEKKNLSEQLEQFNKPMYSPYDPETGEGLERPEPTPEELAEPYAAPGRQAERACGILFRADHETLEDGMCRQARLHATALARHVPLLLTSVQHRVRHGDQSFSAAGDTMLHPEVFEQVKHLRHARISNILASIYHTTIRSAQSLRGLIIPDYARGTIGAADSILSRSIVYTPWERTTVDPEVVKILNRVGQLWLQCSRNAKTFEDAGVSADRIHLVPNAYDPSSPVAQIPTTHPEPPSGRRYYNIGKWEPRKNQHGLIGAFLSGFKPTDPVSLTIKTSYFGKWAGYQGPTESVRFWLDRPYVRAQGWTAENLGKRLVIYDRFFTEEQMTALHRLHNIYVSASHAEGWDYPAFDAKTAGNRLVYVPFSGAEDYADETDVAVETRDEWELVHVGYHWEKNAAWAKVNNESLAAAMQAATRPSRRTYRGDLAERYGVKACGARMHTLVSSLLSEKESAMLLEEMGRR